MRDNRSFRTPARKGQGAGTCRSRPGGTDATAISATHTRPSSIESADGPLTSANAPTYCGERLTSPIVVRRYFAVGAQDP